MEPNQVQWLWDQLQIQQVLATYCRGIDRCDKQLLKTAYWPDALEEHGIFTGNAMEWADFIVPLIGTMKMTMHAIGNSLIDIDGDQADAETYVNAYHLMDDPAGGQTEMIVAGRYLDRFERRQGEWRIARRTFVMDWNQNRPASVQWEGGMYGALKVRGSNDRQDPSYRLFRPHQA